MDDLAWNRIYLETFGLVAGIAGGLAYLSSNIVHLRVLLIISSVLTIIYALFSGTWAQALLNVGTVLICVYKLWGHHVLLKKVAAATSKDFNLDWLKPFMKREIVPAGTVLFLKGEPADAAYHVVSGKVRVVEAGVLLGPGDFFGEMALFLDKRERTATVITFEECELLKITYDDLTTLYFQNPTFGFQLVRLIVGRQTSRRDPARETSAVPDPVSAPTRLAKSA